MTNTLNLQIKTKCGAVRNIAECGKSLEHFFRIRSEALQVGMERSLAETHKIYEAKASEAFGPRNRLGLQFLSDAAAAAEQTKSKLKTVVAEKNLRMNVELNYLQSEPIESARIMLPQIFVNRDIYHIYLE